MRDSEQAIFNPHTPVPLTKMYTTKECKNIEEGGNRHRGESIKQTGLP